VAEEDRQRHIALVGILATAAVGISGTAASFFIARDDRANQRAVEHEARVYDKRAEIYVNALELAAREQDDLEREYGRLQNAGREPRVIPLPTRRREGRLTRIHLTAFGSDPAVAAYLDIATAARHFQDLERSMIHSRSGGEKRRTLSRLETAKGAYTGAMQRLENQVANELR
jgi:hypothetical protein